MLSGTGAHVTDYRPLGVRLVLWFKASKAAVALSLSLALFIGLPFGLSSRAQVWALHFRDHVSHPWSTALAEFFVTSSRHLPIVAIALALEGTFTCVLAWALARGHWWGPWLVVVALSGLIPWEIYEIVRHPQWLRVFLLLLNVSIVAYLTVHALRLRRLRKQLTREQVFPHLPP